LLYLFSLSTNENNNCCLCYCYAGVVELFSGQFVSDVKHRPLCCHNAWPETLWVCLSVHLSVRHLFVITLSSCTTRDTCQYWQLSLQWLTFLLTCFISSSASIDILYYTYKSSTVWLEHWLSLRQLTFFVNRHGSFSSFWREIQWQILPSPSLPFPFFLFPSRSSHLSSSLLFFSLPPFRNRPPENLGNTLSSPSGACMGWRRRWFFIDTRQLAELGPLHGSSSPIRFGIFQHENLTSGGRYQIY